MNKVKKVSSISGTYKSYRSTYKLGKKDYSKESIWAIRDKWYFGFGDSLKEQYGEFRKGLDEKEQNRYYGKGASEYRKYATYMTLLSDKKGVSREECWENYKTLLISKPTKEEMSKQAYCWERVFEVLLESDISKFKLDKMSDVVEGVFDDDLNLALAMFEIEPGYLDKYEKMIEDPEIKCALTKEQFKEVRARWDFYYHKVITLRNITNYRARIKKLNFDLDKALELSAEEINNIRDECLDNFDNDRMELYNLAGQVKFELEDLMDLPGYYENLRKEKYKFKKDGTASALKSIRARQAEYAKTGKA